MGASVTWFGISFDVLRQRWAERRPPTEAASVYKKWAERYLAGEDSWTAQAYTVLGLCSEHGMTFEEPELTWAWGYNLDIAGRLSEVLEAHGVDLSFDLDPALDAPVELPPQEDWPNLQFIRAERVRAAHERLEASLVRPYPELEQALGQLRATELSGEQKDALAEQTLVLRWLPGESLDLFFAGVDLTAEPEMRDYLIERGSRLLSEEQERMESKGTDYEPLYFDWRSVLSGEALRRVLRQAAERGDGLVLGQH